jgi:biopolymer transport protein ExbD
MAVVTNNKKGALVITTHTKILSHIKSVMDKFGIIIHNEFDSLSSVRVIKRSIADTSNTVFIRKAFMRLINDKGPPALILLDYRIDLGSDSISDPGHRKLLRTFFISYIILLQKVEFNDISANFILFTDSDDDKEARALENDPLKILDILTTTNEDINNLIKNIRLNPGQFNRMFQVRIVTVDRVQDDLEKTVASLLSPPATESTGSAHRASAEEIKQKEPQIAAKPAENAPPTAMIAYLTSDKKAYINNRQVDIEKNKFLKSLIPRQFYILGRCDNKNQYDVAGIIRQAIKNGFDKISFSQEDEIVINITDNCTIDSTVISLLTGLFTQDLAKFKRKTVNVNYKNAAILEKSTGYIIIKKYIRHTY